MRGNMIEYQCKYKMLLDRCHLITAEHFYNCHKVPEVWRCYYA